MRRHSQSAVYSSGAMVDGCSEDTRPPRPPCPANGRSGRPVSTRTVKAVLTHGALARASPVPHYFCADPACDVVYFDTAGGCYRQSDVQIPVLHKQSPGQRLLCYCFGESEASIQHEIVSLGRSNAVGRIQGHIKAGRCACDTRNPTGTCCLRDVRDAVARLTPAMPTDATTAPDKT